jgi:hypothetical protein
MSGIILFLGLLLFSPHAVVAQAPSAAAPDSPGVYAVTDRGIIELKVFGERQSVEAAIDTFSFRRSAIGEIPTVATVRSFQVNMSGWTPKDLYLVAGEKALSDPRDDYRRLLGRAYSRGPVLFEVVTEKLEPTMLEREYRSLTAKKRPGADIRAFVVLEVNNQHGLNRRSYPVRIELPTEPPKN